MCRISNLFHISCLMFLLDVVMKPDTVGGGTLRKSRMVWYDFKKYPEKKYDLPVSIYISDKFDDVEAQKIEDSLAELMCRTCLDFNFFKAPLKKDEQFLQINKIKLETNKDGSVNSGYADGNTVNLAELTRAVIVHEVLHALGADHTMTRPDRDQYIRIIKPDSQEAIIADALTFGFPYEYDSIMHYDDADRYRVLKEPIAENTAKMGRSITMTDNDVKSIQLVYCDKKTNTVLQPTDEQCKLAAEVVEKERKEQEAQELEDSYRKGNATGDEFNDTFSGDNYDGDDDRNGTMSGDDDVFSFGSGSGDYDVNGSGSGSGDGGHDANSDNGGSTISVMDSSDNGASVDGGSKQSNSADKEGSEEPDQDRSV